MQVWQQNFLLFFVGYSLLCFILGFYNSRKKNYLGVCHLFYPLGAYVWADAVIFGLFWAMITVVVYYLKNWYLFLTFYFVFQTIRTFGESIYWFNQQFSTVNRNPGERQWPHFFFRDEYTTWFVYQIMWQCVCAVCTIFAIYFSYMWLGGYSR